MWVEVTLAPALGTDGAAPGWQPGGPKTLDPASGPAPPGTPPRDALAARSSRFCVTLVVVPPAGAWGVAGQGLGVRACWGVPAGPGPTTGAQLRAARVLWIVGVGPTGTPSSQSLIVENSDVGRSTAGIAAGEVRLFSEALMQEVGKSVVSTSTPSGARAPPGGQAPAGGALPARSGCDCARWRVFLAWC